MTRETWKQFAQLGFLAAPFAEEYGGIGGGAIETMIIMEEYGRRLVVEPFIETVVLSGGLLRDFGSEDQGAHFCRALSTAATSGPWAATPRGRGYPSAFRPTSGSAEIAAAPSVLASSPQ